MGDFGPLPKIHPRERIIDAAELEILGVCLETFKKHDLTTAERLRVLNSVLGGQIGNIAKYAIRAERHGDSDKPGGTE